MLPPIVSLSPLRSAVFGWRGANARMLTLVCKATYVLRPVESPLADQQEDIVEGDDYWDDDPARSLRQPSDLVPSKPRAEVLVVGSAFAPDGAPRARVPVRVIVGDVDKALAILGDHAVLADGSVANPSSFTKMALRYERAAGGPGTVNPVGVGREIDTYGKRHLPNIVPIDATPAADLDSEPVGLGPIAPRWPLRAARLGSGAARAWAERGDLEEPWPSDFDASYFLAAPWDQRLDALRSNERIVLENLHPSHARLATSLPGVEPRVFVDVEQGTPHELSMRCDTLWIDTDRGTATLTWRGELHAEHPLPARIIVASSNSGRRLSWDDVAPLVRGRSSMPSISLEDDGTAPVAASVRGEREPDAPADATAPLRIGVLAPALPFVKPRLAPAPVLASPPPAIARASPAIAPAPPPLAPAPPPLVAPTPTPSSPTMASVPSNASPPTVASVSRLGGSPAASANAQAIPEPPSAAAPPSRWDPVKGAERTYSGPRAFRSTAAAKVGASAPPDFSAAGSAAALASNAAAGQSAPPPPAAKLEAPAEAPAPSSARRGAERTFVDLLWFDPLTAPRLRTTSPFKGLLGTELGRVVEPKDADEVDLRERRDVARVLTGGSPLDGEPLRRAIEEQFDDPSTCSHPLVLVAGELSPSFDEIATLKAAVQLGTALGGGDKRIRDAAAVAAEALRGDPPPRETALGLYRTIVEAAAKSGGPPFTPAITKVLLDQRAFRKRHLFGAPRVRMELTTAKSTAPVPVYLPEAAEAMLPCLARFRVRLLAEVRPQEDYAETSTDSYLAFALGRVLRGA